MDMAEHKLSVLFKMEVLDSHREELKKDGEKKWKKTTKQTNFVLSKLGLNTWFHTV